VREAFEKPTLRLLDRTWAPLVLAVFRLSFGRDQRAIPAERMHAQVEACLEELRSLGEKVPAASGRALCLEWMRGQWLFRNIADSGQEEYSLTSHALEALDLVQSLSHDRALISESRINTILDAARRWAMEANPDRQARIDRIEVQIRQLTSERDRLLGGGDLATATDDRMVDGYANLVDLIRQLPSDFKRVEEAVVAMHRQIISDFRGEDRPISEVIDDYLRKTDELTTLTPEGRAFEGAFMLLRDDALLLELRKDLDTILDHPFSAALTAVEQRDFRKAVTVIRRGIDDVLAQRSRLTTTLRDHIVNHDVIRDRELEDTLRRINRHLELWMTTAGPRSTVPVELLPPPVDVEQLREQFWNPANDLPPPPLEDMSDSAPEPLSLDDVRAQGGPALPRLRASLIAAVQSGDADSLGSLFNSLPADLRRPVEILGLLHLLADLEPDTDTFGDPAEIANSEDTVAGRTGGTRGSDTVSLEVFDAVRPNGTQRHFLVPLHLLPGNAATISTGDEGSADV